MKSANSVGLEPGSADGFVRLHEQRRNKIAGWPLRLPETLRKIQLAN